MRQYFYRAAQVKRQRNDYEKERNSMHLHSNSAFNTGFPHVLLQKYVLYYNIVFPKQNMFAVNYTLMPNACSTLSVTCDGNHILAELWGVSARPNMLGNEPNQYQVMLLIQLSPYGLYQLTRYNQSEFADRRIFLHEVDQELALLLCQALEEADSVQELFAVCDKILYKRIEYSVVSDALCTATNIISSHRGQILASDVARNVGYSDRQLRRLFLSQIGMNVKSYARLARFNYVLKHMKRETGGLSELAQQAGYFDQAHFDRDFRAISGVNPKTYLKELSAFYYNGPETIHTMF